MVDTSVIMLKILKFFWVTVLAYLFTAWKKMQASEVCFLRVMSVGEAWLDPDALG